jgi:hypothetical protein
MKQDLIIPIVLLQYGNVNKTLLDDIQAQGQVFTDDLYWAFKCLKTIQQPTAFVRYIEDEKTEWKEGSNLTAAELCKFAETNYKHLLEAGKWKSYPANSVSEPSDKTTDKEDSKFVALVAAVKELAKSVSKPPDNSDGQKNKWKYEAPPTGASIEKQVNGRTF